MVKLDDEDGHCAPPLLRRHRHGRSRKQPGEVLATASSCR